MNISFLSELSTGIVILDDSLEIIFINSSALSILDTTEKNSIGNTIDQIFYEEPESINDFVGALELNRNFTKTDTVLNLKKGKRVFCTYKVHSIENNNEKGLMLEIIDKESSSELIERYRMKTNQQISQDFVRGLAHEIKNPLTGDVLIKKDEMIEEAGCEKIDAAGVKSINVYSVMTCGAKEGVCATSYGRDLSRGKMVHVGEAIGMISAQSIGEPGTQLTMRTFHVGGTASVKQESQIVSNSEGTLKIVNTNLIKDSKNNQIVMGRNTEISIEDDNGLQVASYKVPYGSKLFFENAVSYTHLTLPTSDLV